MRAARQGTLDGLCGVYAIINSLDLAGLKLRRCQLHTELFIQLTHGLGAAALLSAMNDGLEASDLLRAAKLAFSWLSSQHGIDLEIRQPYRSTKFTSAEAYITAIREQAAVRDTAVIVQLRRGTRYHWTVVKGFSREMIRFRDSGHLIELRLERISLDQGPFALVTAETLTVQNEW